MCRFTYLSFFYTMLFCVAIPTHGVCRTLEFHLTLKQGASNLQARKRSHTHSVYFRLATIAKPNFTKCKNTSLKIM